MTDNITLPYSVVMRALLALWGADQIDKDAIAALTAAMNQQAEPVAPKCVAIIEVLDKDWRMEYLSLPVGKHKLYVQQYTYTAPLQQQAEPVAFITPLMEQQMFDDWCPYKGNPDPRTVWAAAIEAVNGLLLGASPPQQQAEPVGLIESLKDAQPCCGEYVTCWRACTPRGKFLGQQESQRKPLTEEEISEIASRLEQQGNTMRQFARAIEAAHGIKEGT